jgi:hypothetical protein
MRKATWLKMAGILICVFFLSSGNMFAQCSTPSEKVFENVSKEDVRAGIIERYNQFIKSYCSHDFEEIYKLLSNNYLRVTQFKDEKDFVAFKQSYYSDSQTKFISFLPEEVDEVTETSSWILRGCLTEIVDGKKSKLKSNLYIWKERDSYFFSDISPVVVSLNGKTEKCK